MVKLLAVKRRHLGRHNERPTTFDGRRHRLD
jgi:hypothetical protein